MKINSKLGFFLGLALAVSIPILAATFTQFSPATGVLKGNASTYVTTAATSSDIRAMWTGTCDLTTFLRGDGQCAVAGTVTSVGLTMPGGFSVSGSPVTSSGTLGVTTTLNGVVHGNGSALTAGNVSLTSEVTGLLPVSNGGTGQGSLSTDNVFLGNGTGAMTGTAIPNCGSSSQALAYSTGTHTFSCQTVTGSATPPGGSNTQIQYNNSGAFGGDADFTWDATNNIMTIGSSATPGFLFGGANAAGGGPTFTVKSGGAGATNNGGSLVLEGGSGGATSGAGGSIIVRGGPATDGNGGSASVLGNSGTGTNRNGGQANLTGGTNSGSGSPGNAVVTGGAGTNAGVDGGSAILQGGAPADGNGGLVSIVGRNGVGTNRNGGAVAIASGSPTGSGTAGSITGTVAGQSGFSFGSTAITFGNATNNPSFTFQGSGSVSANNLRASPVATAEGLRVNNDTAFVSFFNTANTTRSGYLQFNTATAAILNVEIAQGLQLATSGTARLTIGSGGDWSVGGGVGSSGQVLTSNGAGTPPSWQSPSGSVTSGSFTATFDDACTTSPTVTFVWQKIGNAVTMMPTASSGFPCTGDSTSFAAAASPPVPAAERPATSPVTMALMVGATDNGATTLATITIGTSGILQYNKVTTTTVSWTAAGNRSTPLFSAFTYMTNN